jgi:flagellin-like hook-associated protein FlgL
VNSISIIGGMAADQARLRSRIDTLTRQAGTGQKGDTHGVLGPDARRSIDLRGDMARREAYVGATGAALGRMGTVQQVLGRLETLASDAAAEAARARTLGATGVEALARTARAALEEVASLLNTRQGGDYLFSGSDLAVAPVPDASNIATGPMASAIQAAVATLTPSNAATVLADTATAATAAATTPFSAFLEGPALAEPRRGVQVADGQRLSWGVLANQDSTGEVAASWGRELLRGLATLAALTPATAAQDTGYDALLLGVNDVLTGATRGLAQERGVLGAAERQAEEVRERHENLLVTVKAQLISVEQVDLAEVSAVLRQTQVRLEASYNMTAQVAQLSLAALLR